jgi:hypothetical protein
MNNYFGSKTINKDHLKFVDHIVEMSKPNILWDEFYDRLSIEDALINSLAFTEDIDKKAEKIKKILEDNEGKDLVFLKSELKKLIGV